MSVEPIDVAKETLCSSLASAARAISDSFDQASHGWLRGRTPADAGARSEEVRQSLDLADAIALHALREMGAPAETMAAASIRIAGELRRMQQVVSTLDALPRLPSSLTADFLEQVDHLVNLAAVQVETSHECFRGGEALQADKLTAEEAFLDDWYDVLLVDMLDDLGERPTQEQVAPLLGFARALERIGGHARGVVESASLLRAYHP